MGHFFAYMARMKHIQRWGLMRCSQEENVQEHSLQVAMIAHCLATIENQRYGGCFNAEHVMALAVFHETAEVITGDLVTPVKYFNQTIAKAYKQVENIAEEKMIGMLPQEMQNVYRPLIQPQEEAEKRLVKAADKLAAYAKCVEELKMGNMEFSKAKESVLRSIHAMHVASAEDFLEEYMPSFSITLDELNEN